MKIAILAWGSLIWERRELALTGNFVPIGPKLPLEFSRVSGDKRLTLVIDEALGVSCTSYAARSAHDDLEAALIDIWKREGSPDEKLPERVRHSTRVAFASLTTGERSDAARRQSSTVDAIGAWASQHDYEAVIWTSLASNFEAKTQVAFSVEAAIGHLEELDEQSFARALNYIWRAPPEVKTPLRSAVTARWPVIAG